MAGKADIVEASAELVGFDICGFSRFAEQWLAGSDQATVDDLARVWERGVAPQIERLNSRGYTVADLYGDAVLLCRELPLGEEADVLLQALERDFAQNIPGLAIRTGRAFGPMARIATDALGTRHEWVSGPAVEALHRKLIVRRRPAAGTVDRMSIHPAAGSGLIGEWTRFGAEICARATLFLRAVPQAWMWTDRARIAELVHHVAACAAGEDGHLEKITHDDKGLLFRCTFAGGSAEPIAAAVEAGRAALRLMPAGSGAGISAGPTYCGPVTAGPKSWRTIHGPAVNRAAKASSIAAIAAAVPLDESSERCLRQLGFMPEDSGVWTDRRPEGGTAGIHTATDQRETIVGRDTEAAEILHLLQASTSDAAILIEAPAGHGKSALVRHILDTAAGSFAPIVARARPTDGPRGPWPDLLASLVRQTLSMTPRALADALCAVGVAADDLSLLPYLGLATQASDRAAPKLPPAVLRDRLDRLFAAILQLAPPNGLIVIEDIHWLTPEAVRWLHDRRALGHLGILMTGRPRADPALLPSWARRHALAPLGKAETDALIDLIRPDLAGDPETKARIALLSRGSPLLVRQLALACPAPSSGEQPASEVPSVAGLSSEEMLARAVDVRVEGLDPDELAVLRKIAIEAEGCARSDLAREPVLGGPPLVMQAVAGLVERDLVRVDEGGRIAASHDLIAEAVRRRTPGLLLRVLHADTARRLVREHAHRAALIGSHWRGAGSNGRAGLWLARAGQEAEETGAYRDAMALYESALDCCAPDAAHHRHSQMWRARLAASAFAAGDLARGRDEAQACARGARLAPSRRLALLVRSEIATFAAEPLVVLRCLRELRGLRGSEEIGIRGREASLLGYTLSLCRLRTLGRTIMRGGARHGPRDAFYTLTGMGLVHICFGEWTPARSVLGEALDLAPGYSMPQENGVVVTLLALAAYLSGRLEESFDLFEELASSGCHRANPLLEGWGLYGAAQALIALDHLSGASTRLDRAELLLAGSVDRQSHLICSGLRILLADRQHGPTAVLDAMDRNRSLAEAMPVSNFGSFEGYKARAVIALRHLRANTYPPDIADAFETHLHSSLRLLSRYALLFPIGRPRLDICRAELQLRKNRPARARRLGQRGLERARRLHMPSEIIGAQSFLEKLKEPS